ncbi:HEPACAM family member 2 [Pygocentrus nattereri]|uniref:Ig-like domain-containing protein n=1 Tax=Pygocentrus nattereri TaxID=42514 RepID=A0A3B4BQW7_PYGNA|nr:HEPACAM family member 2 [Pygocentrus nattereri]
MESFGIAVSLLLCVMIQMSGANTELISVPLVMHGTKGKSLHIPVETHFGMNQVEFQGTWSQISPKENHLVTFENSKAIPNLQLKDTLIFNLTSISLTFKQLDEAAEGEYQLQINIIFPGQDKLESVIKTVSITVNVPLSTPVMKKSSEGTLVEDQDNVTLTCIVENGAKAKYQWLKNGKMVSLSERHIFSQNNTTLFINPVKKEDIGMYSCAVANPISHARSKVMELSVFYGPYNLEVNSDQGLRIGEVFTVNQGELIFFDCLADSNPPNTCVWISRTDNGTEVLMTGPRFEVPPHKLAQPTKFLCRAFNNMTKKQDEAHFTLVVANLGKGSEKLQGESAVSPLAAITISSLLIILCMLFVLFRKTCHPKRVLMKIYNRPMPEQKGLHRSGHEDATEDFGIYEFVSIPGKMESNHASCRSLARLDSVKDLHTTIYDVIRHVPETPTLSLLK